MQRGKEKKQGEIKHLAFFSLYRKLCHSAVLVNGKREWVAYQTLYVDGEDFEEIGVAFELQGKVSRGILGNSSICLMRQRDVVDFAVDWIQKNRFISLP